MGMHSYYVKYLDRDGRSAYRMVMASSPAEARKRAAEDGCDDIISARRANFFRRNLTRLLVIAVIIAVLAYLI
ncbi:MAG: hypothetical protein IKE55_09050 [Kiritimatiellae bacterium]|nr:hypothetical protein [Kiritimatiellia bacterium]